MGLMGLYLIFMIIVLMLGLLSWLVSFSGLYDEESMCSFECGFISFQGSRMSFSLQFFLLAIIFLIFDVEIALILPLPATISEIGVWSSGVFISVFAFIILGGLYYEWGAGMLDWGI
uniref:NADH-ubiquinone oxidoreductase chain 3 n=1 Tax=Xystodesmus sp. YD-2016 TaxID=1904352 RepID=A0A1S5RS87_9MYRI|nr:NADH dehydrogenase subunit 3 [Xystodesmus sp. YD-2016]